MVCSPTQVVFAVVYLCCYGSVEFTGAGRCSAAVGSVELFLLRRPPLAPPSPASTSPLSALSLFPFSRLFVISLERLRICVLRTPICVCVCVSVLTLGGTVCSCSEWGMFFSPEMNQVGVFLASPCRHRCCRLIEFNEIPSVKLESKAWSCSRDILSQMLHLLRWPWAPHCLLCHWNHFK